MKGCDWEFSRQIPAKTPAKKRRRDPGKRGPQYDSAVFGLADENELQCLLPGRREVILSRPSPSANDYPRRAASASRRLAAALVALAALPALFAAGEEPAKPAEPAKPGQSRKTETAFSFPCDKYMSGLKGPGNFGLFIPRGASAAFGGTYHLAEDVWLEGGTPVKCVADGVVAYSDFSQTWTDEKGRKHWNLGNVMVIEHKLDPPEGALEYVCSFYVHMGKDRKFKTGDQVARDEVIGSIGADKSEENGGYPAHIHFGMHKGRYVQIPPSWEQEVRKAAEVKGLPVSPGIRSQGEKPDPPPAPAAPEFLKGEVAAVELWQGTNAKVTFKNSEKYSIFSLLVGSSSPDYKSAPIMCWCCGYGDKATLAEWIKPSEWIKGHPLKPEEGKDAGNEKGGGKK